MKVTASFCCMWNIWMEWGKKSDISFFLFFFPFLDLLGWISSPEWCPSSYLHNKQRATQPDRNRIQKEVPVRSLHLNVFFRDFFFSLRDRVSLGQRRERCSRYHNIYKEVLLHILCYHWTSGNVRQQHFLTWWYTWYIFVVSLNCVKFHFRSHTILCWWMVSGLWSICP